MERNSGAETETRSPLTISDLLSTISPEEIICGPNRGSKAHNYEVTKIELFEAPSTGGIETSSEPLAMTSSNSISAAKLLQMLKSLTTKAK